MEDVIKKNLLAIRQDNSETRALCYKTIDEVKTLKNIIQMQNEQIEQIRIAINQIRIGLVTGSTS